MVQPLNRGGWLGALNTRCACGRARVLAALTLTLTTGCVSATDQSDRTGFLGYLLVWELPLIVRWIASLLVQWTVLVMVWHGLKRLIRVGIELRVLLLGLLMLAPLYFGVGFTISFWVLELGYLVCWGVLAWMGTNELKVKTATQLLRLVIVGTVLGLGSVAMTSVVRPMPAQVESYLATVGGFVVSAILPATLLLLRIRRGPTDPSTSASVDPAPTSLPATVRCVQCNAPLQLFEGRCASCGTDPTVYTL